MNGKRIIGILLIVISIVLFVIVGSEVQKYVSLTGLRFGALASYNPPFAYHGPLVVLAGICASASLLTGLHLIGRDRKK